MPATTQIRSQVSLNPLTWYRVAVTFDGTTPTLYINGVAVATAPIVTPLNAPSVEQLRFGQSAFTDSTVATAVKFNNPDAAGDEHITVPDSASLDITGTAITVEAWVKRTSQENAYEQTIVGRAGAWRLELYIEEGTEGGYNVARFRIQTTDGTFESNSYFRIRSGQWYHIAGVYDGAFLRLYVNGSEVLDPVEATGTLLDVAVPVLFGARDTAPAVDPLFGEIAEVRIWNVARTQAQIQAGLNLVSAPQSGLAGIWRLDEASGTTANDVSGNANHGTLTNGPTWASTIGDLSFGDMRVWTTVRTPAEIAANLDAITPPQTGLLALYEFNATTGSTAEDDSGNAHDAALTGTYVWISEDVSGILASAGKLEVVLTWDATAGDSANYTVLRSETGDVPFFLIGNVVSPASRKTFHDTNVVAGKTYYYKIFRNGSAWAEMSATPTGGAAESSAARSVVVLRR